MRFYVIGQFQKRKGTSYNREMRHQIIDTVVWTTLAAILTGDILIPYFVVVIEIYN